MKVILTKNFITCFIFNFDIEIKAINIQRQKEMHFLIRYIYNNIFYYKSDRIVKILVKLGTVFYFLSIKFCTVIRYPCSKLLLYISYGNSCLYTIYIGNKAQKSQQHLQQFSLKSHSCAVVYMEQIDAETSITLYVLPREIQPARNSCLNWCWIWS